MTTDLSSAAQVVGLLQGQVTELLGRALEAVESVHAWPRVAALWAARMAREKNTIGKELKYVRRKTHMLVG
jgi:hypothetical protein